MSVNDYKISKGVVYPPPPTLASDEEFGAGISTTASPSVKQVKTEFATPTDISTATSGLASQEWVEQKILSANPTGTIVVWSTATAPAGYLICDGSAISRTTYSNLFSVIGTIYGDGDGSTTFNLPKGDYEFGGLPDYTTGVDFNNGASAQYNGFVAFNIIRTRDNDITLKIGTETFKIWAGQSTYNAFNQFCIFPIKRGDLISCNFTPTNLKIYRPRAAHNYIIKY